MGGMELMDGMVEMVKEVEETRAMGWDMTKRTKGWVAQQWVFLQHKRANIWQKFT